MSNASSTLVRIGLYGCNMYRTRDLMNGLRAVADGRYAVVACFDLDRAKADFAAKTYGGRPSYDEADFLKQDFDVAIISLPPALHPQAYAHTAQAGKDVYLEKPVCVDAAGRQVLIDAARRYRVRCYVGMSYRFVAPFRKTAELLRRPESGRLIGMHHHWLAPGYTAEHTPESNWRNRLEGSGGQLIFHCCHVLDWFRWVGGEVRSVTATSYTPAGIRLPHEERELTACLEFVNGGMAVFNLSQESHQYIQYGTVHAENVGMQYQWGTNTFVKEYHHRPRAAERAHEWSMSPTPGDGSDPERTALQMADFFEAYAMSKPMPCTLADGIRIYDIAVAIRESYRSGRKVTLEAPVELPLPMTGRGA